MNRRSFLKASATSAAGLWIGFRLPESSKLAAETRPLKLNAFVHVGTDDIVTLFIHKAEMGQGTVTSLSQLLAEELECDWNKIRTEFAPVDREFGPFQGVVGSASIRSSWDSLRKSGAIARTMLIQAAAEKWGVDKSQCRAENSSVVNTATNARLSYGSLAEAASKLPVPQAPPLKDPKQFRLVGKSIPRRDTPDKVDGKAVFGIDVRLPGMLYAVVARSPVFGGKAASFNATKARAVAGVKDVVQISNGVAVVATNTWSAMQGRKVLQIQWDEGSNAAVNSAGISKLMADRAEQTGVVARKEGDAEAGLLGAAKKVEAVYEVPFLAHAAMEPLNCVAHVRPDGCEVWASTQMQTMARDIAAKVTGLKPEQVNLHTTLLGGGFGRRGGVDYIREGVEVAQQVAKTTSVPVKTTWSREDDMQHDMYRPASYAHFHAGLDADGWPVAWTTRIACPSFEGGRVDRAAVEGLSDLRYGIPNLQIDWRVADTGIPTSYWRAVGYTQNSFFAESFLDELAAAGGKDPVELRRKLLGKNPRMLAVLDLAAEKAGWGQPLPAGRTRGVAVVNNIGSFTAQVAEVSVNPQGHVQVHKVVCAVDCGHVVNPAIVTQQIQSAIVYGLTAALKGGITIDHGRVQQENFHQYEVLRINEMPVIEVHIVPSENTPGGIGEAGVPPIAPAVANAIFAATGKRIRKLPISMA